MNKVFSIMIKLLMRCYSTIAEPSQRTLNARIARQFHLWIAEKKYCRPDLSMADVAEEFGVSEEALSFYFSNVVGDRFSSFRKKLRLEEARRLICENPACKLSHIANRVGIPDKCNFRKQFYSVYGFPPSEWQRQCAEMKRKR